MLLLADSLRDLSFQSLMEIYIEANKEHGRDIAPDEPEPRQIAISEQDFYAYLHDSFLRTPGARIAVWLINERYVSALRLEPYQDGLLLEALETDPQCRKQGYAAALITAVQEVLRAEGKCLVYSHVNKTNTASLKTHEKCGFRILTDYASYIDGSINNRAYTMIWEG